MYDRPSSAQVSGHVRSFFDLSVISTVFDIHRGLCKICSVFSLMFGVLWCWLRMLDFFVDFVQVFAFLKGFCCGLSLAV